jgi:hypothetical protein
MIGVEEEQGRAANLKPIAGDRAKTLADQLRNVAIHHVKPGQCLPASNSINTGY